MPDTPPDLAALLWECPHCGFEMHRRHHDAARTDPCPACAELRLRTAIAEHHAQKADDRCWMDDAKLYAASGLPPGDPRVGDKAAMLKNCERFIALRCEGGGPWKSYAELEAEAERLTKDNREFVRLARAAHEAYWRGGVVETALHELHEHTKGCGWTDIPEPVVKQCLDREDRLAARVGELEAENERLRAELAEWKPMTPEQAEAALDAAEAAPLSDERIAEIVRVATDPATTLPNSQQAQLAADNKRLRRELETSQYEAKLATRLLREYKETSQVVQDCAVFAGFVDDFDRQKAETDRLRAQLAECHKLLADVYDARTASVVVEAASREIGGASVIQISRQLWDACVSAARHDLALADACRRLLAAERKSAACEGLSPGSFGAYLEIRQRLHDAKADIGRIVGDAGEV